MNSPTRQHLLARDLQQVREHAAEIALFNRPSPSLVVRQQLDKYHANQAEIEAERQYRREDAYQPPAPAWVQWTLMPGFVAVMTYALLKGAELALEIARGVL